MDITNLCLLVVLFLMSVPLLTFPTLSVVSFWYNTATRSDVSLVDSYVSWVDKRLPDKLLPVAVFTSVFSTFFFLTGFGILSAQPEKLSEVLFHLPLSFIVVPTLVVGSPFIARFVLDLCRGLKWDKNTGKLDEVEELRKKIEKLEKERG